MTIAKKNLLGGLMLALVLGLGLRVVETPVRAAETTAVAHSSDTAGAAQAQENDKEVDETDAYRHSASVRWIGAKLGWDANRSADVFEWLNFAVLAVFVLWGLAKVLPKTLRGRTEKIQKHLADARTATEEARGRLGAVEDRLARLDGEIAAMRAQSETDSARDEVRIKASVEEETKKILAAAEQEIAAATLHAQKQLQQHAAELAIEQAARKLVVSAETDRLLVQGFAERLTRDDAKKGQN
ncbi:MAG TPA: ATP synthase F0 subunit B [Acidobacteriaceae bacterium]|nr:ATP synthase F0 subunit B [Acidobacteriaceae bacterium]